MSNKPVFLAFALLAGCNAAPDLGTGTRTGVDTGPYPDLVPTEALRAQAAEPRRQGGTGIEDTAAQLEARASSLRARAAAVRGDVIDGSTKDRLGASIEIDEEAN